MYTEEDVPFVMDKATAVKTGTDVLIVACGEMVSGAKTAAEQLEQEGISAGVLDMYCIKPLDTESLLEAAKPVKLIVTVEEHSPFGGLGAAVCQCICAAMPKEVANLALPDAPVITGTSKEVFKHYGLDAEGIVKKVREEMGK